MRRLFWHCPYLFGIALDCKKFRVQIMPCLELLQMTDNTCGAVCYFVKKTFIQLLKVYGLASLNEFFRESLFAE